MPNPFSQYAPSGGLESPYGVNPFGKYKTSVPLETQLDRASGAPYTVRSAVGGAMTPEDRLATLRKFYPSAQPFGDSNFVFTDPQTKRPTLYNPPGLDVGDLGSVQPEAAEVLGGVAGGIMATPAAVAGALPTGGMSFLAIPAGVGLGAAGGRELENAAMTALGGRADTRGLGTRLTDAAVTTGMNAVGQRVSDLALRGGKALIGAAARSLMTRGMPQETYNAFLRQGIRPPAGAVSGSPMVQSAEQTLANTPGGGTMIRRGMADTVEGMGRAVRGLAQATGQGMSPQDAGGFMQKAAQAAADRFARRREVLDDAIETAIGRDRPVPIRNVLMLRLQLQRELSVAPASRRPEFERAIGELNGLIQDAVAAPGGRTAGMIPFGALRAVRTRIGTQLDAPDVTGFLEPGAKRGLQRVYGALAQDIQAAARAAGPAGQRALQLHDRYVRLNRTINLPVIQQIMDAGAPEKAWQFAMAEGKIGGTRLQQLRRQFGPLEWNEVVSSTLAKMGYAKPGQQGMPVELLGPSDTFSPSTFLTNFASLSPEAKQALFGGSRYARLRGDLEDLVLAASAMRESERLANPSGTSRGMFYGALLTGAGGVAGMAATGQVGAAAGSAVALGGSVLSGYQAARLLTNPQFVRWLATGMRLPASPAAISRHLGRLATIAEGEPDLRDAIDQYRKAFRAIGTQGGMSSAGQTAPAPQ